MTKLYVKRAETVEAFQIPPVAEGRESWPEWLKEQHIDWDDNWDMFVCIPNWEYIRPGDYVIKRRKEIDVIEPEEFHRLYKEYDTVFPEVVTIPGYHTTGNLLEFSGIYMVVKALQEPGFCETYLKKVEYTED